MPGFALLFADSAGCATSGITIGIDDPHHAVESGEGSWRSELYPENWQPPDDRVSFSSDAFLQDFSYAGYRRGEEPIPDRTGPVFDVTDYGADPTGASDSTSSIQNAIYAAQAVGGGVVYLPAGEFRISPGPLSFCLRIDSSNIVLRGAGTEETFLLNTSHEMRGKSVISVGPSEVSTGDPISITADLAGPTRRIPVSDASQLAAGDIIRIEWAFTKEWIAEHKQEAYWSEAVRPDNARYYREVRVSNPSEGWIEVDSPLRYSIQMRDQPRIYKVGGLRNNIGGMRNNIGLESFSIGNLQHPDNGWGETDYGDPAKAAYDVHTSCLIRMQHVRDSWIRNIHSRQATENTTTAHLLSNGIVVVNSFRVTVSECEMRRPQYGGGGGNGYMFRLTYSNDCLVEKSLAEFSRHGLVVSHAGTSGNVFHRCADRETRRAVGSSAAGYQTGGAGSDHHMHFSHSNLWDQCHAHNSYYTASHRRFSGSVPHGLSSAHGVYWNTTGSGTRYSDIVHSEQARYGYVIGTSGSVSGAFNPVGGNTAPADILEGIGRGDTLEPASLYLDQLARRVGAIHDKPPPPGFVQWAGTSDFSQDTNSDRVADGLAWLLGAESPEAELDSFLRPEIPREGVWVSAFKMLNQSSRGDALLELRYSDDLRNWITVAIPESSGFVNGIDFEITHKDPFNEVEATLSQENLSGFENVFIRLTGRFY